MSTFVVFIIVCNIVGPVVILFSKPAGFSLIFTLCKGSALGMTPSISRAHTYVCCYFTLMHWFHIYIHLPGVVCILLTLGMLRMRHTEMHIYDCIYLNINICILLYVHDTWRENPCQLAVALWSIQPQGRCLLDKTWQNDFCFLLQSFFFLSHVIPVLLKPQPFGKNIFLGRGEWPFFCFFTGGITPDSILVLSYFESWWLGWGATLSFKIEM